MPHGTSHEVYKGILDGRARGVFNGRIRVRPDAQKTDAKQTNKTLLLSDDAQVNTKPQLEIFANDVKCTHGATVGQLERGRAVLPARPRHRRGRRPRACSCGRSPPTSPSRIAARAGARRARPAAGRRSSRARWPRRRSHESALMDERPTSTVHWPRRPRRATAASFDVERIRRDFPILQQRGPRQAARLPRQRRHHAEAAGGHRRHHATTTSTDNANIHRGVHLLSERATQAYERRRETVRRFLNARESREIVFVRGTTEAINLVAQAYGRPLLRPGDEIVVSVLEHHSNIVPWQMVCEETGARLRVVPITDAGELRMDEYERLLGDRTRLVALGHVSNALGTINPVGARSSGWPTPAASRCWSTARRRCPTCGWTCRRSTATSTPSPATSCSARPASASSTARRRCSTACRPGRAAAT